MKRIFFIIIFFTIIIQAHSINYYTGAYQDALTKANSENKFILIYFTAKWCGPCQYMSKYILTDNEVESIIDKSYIALKLDVDLDENKSLYQKFYPGNVIGIPKFVIIDSKEEVIKEHGGAMKINQFKSFINIQKVPLVYIPKTDSLILNDSNRSITKPDLLSRLLYNAMASKWRPGFKFGFNQNSFHPNTNSFSDYNTGFNVGIFFENQQKYFFIRPELSYVTKGAKNSSNDEFINLKYIQIPVNLGIDLFRQHLSGCPQPVRLNLIPYGAFAFSGNHKTKLGENNVAFGNGTNGSIKRFDYGIKTGLSFQFGSFEPSIGYDWGLNNLKNGKDKLFNRGFYFEWSLTFGR